MKRVIILLAFLVAGCAQDLTAPLSSVPITSMADYFWSAGTNEKFDSTAVNIDLITAHDSAGVLMVNDSNPSGGLRTTLSCHVSQDSVTAEHVGTRAILDLNKEMSFVAEDTTWTGPWHDGHIVLLKSNPLVDSSWRAGTLLAGGAPSPTYYKPYAIEARFLTRLDTLTVAGVTYPDVLVIRYAKETVPGSFIPDSSVAPYWVIYYARNRGPVMFDRVTYDQGLRTSSFERRALLP